MYGKFKVFKKLGFVFVLSLVIGALSVSCVEVRTPRAVKMGPRTARMRKANLFLRNLPGVLIFFMRAGVKTKTLLWL